MERDTVVFDFDGTLVDQDAIAHLYGDWDAFHSASFDCPERIGVLAICLRLQLAANIIVVTGKPERYRRKLEGWLSIRGVIPEAILMRPNNNFASDMDLKPELMIEHLGPQWAERVIGVFEDRDKMVDRWRAEGVTCFAAAPCLEALARIKQQEREREANDQ